jgi:hypothetical protein
MRFEKNKYGDGDGDGDGQKAGKLTTFPWRGGCSAPVPILSRSLSRARGLLPSWH